MMKERQVNQNLPIETRLFSTDALRRTNLSPELNYFVDFYIFFNDQVIVFEKLSRHYRTTRPSVCLKDTLRHIQGGGGVQSEVGPFVCILQDSGRGSSIMSEVRCHRAYRCQRNCPC